MTKFPEPPELYKLFDTIHHNLIKAPQIPQNILEEQQEWKKTIKHSSDERFQELTCDLEQQHNLTNKYFLEIIEFLQGGIVSKKQCNMKEFATAMHVAEQNQYIKLKS